MKKKSISKKLTPNAIKYIRNNMRLKQAERVLNEQQATSKIKERSISALAQSPNRLVEYPKK